MYVRPQAKAWGFCNIRGMFLPDIKKLCEDVHAEVVERVACRALVAQNTRNRVFFVEKRQIKKHI